MDRCWIFGKLHPTYKTPVLAILVLGGLMLLLIATDSLSIIASLSLFATLLYYIVGMAAACALRVKLPNLKRPYRAPCYGWRAGQCSNLSAFDDSA